MSKYRIKKDTKKITAVIGEGNIGPYHLYQQLKDDYPEISFAIIHSDSPEEIYFNDPNSGKSGFICMSDKEKKLGDLGISKEEYKDPEVCGPYEKVTVNVDSFEGFFKDFVIGLPLCRELAGDAIPSSAQFPLSDDYTHPDWDSFDVILEF